MSRTSNILRSGLSGAGTVGGFSGFNPIAMGAGFLGGAILGAFGDSEEEIRAKRRQEYLNALKEAEARNEANRQKSLSEGTQKIGQYTRGLTKRFRDNAGARAAALGRTSDVESLQLPQTEAVANAGSSAVGDFTFNTNQEYDRNRTSIENMRLQGESNYADRPIEPNAVDYLSELAPLAVQYGQNQQYIDGLNKTREVPANFSVDKTPSRAEIPNTGFDLTGGGVNYNPADTRKIVTNPELLNQEPTGGILGLKRTYRNNRRRTLDPYAQINGGY